MTNDKDDRKACKNQQVNFWTDRNMTYNSINTQEYTKKIDENRNDP